MGAQLSCVEPASPLDVVCQAINRLPMPRGKVRLSIGNIVVSIRTTMMEVGVPIVRLSNSEHQRERVRYDALGGAVALAESGIAYLKGLGASGFKHDPEEGVHDARFVVTDQWVANEVLKWFANLNNAKAGGKPMFEDSPSREVIDELTGDELEGIKPVAPRTDSRWLTVEYRYLGVAVQPPTDGKGTSVNEGKVPSRRIFHCWEMVTLPYDGLYDEIIGASPLIRVLSRADLVLLPGPVLKDGTAVADNVGIPIMRI